MNCRQSPNPLAASRFIGPVRLDPGEQSMGEGTAECLRPARRRFARWQWLHRVAIVCVAGCLAAASGCTALRWPLESRWFSQSGSSDETPARIVAIWTNAVASTPGQPPMRGVGARLMFYGRKLDKPLRANGTLIVYAYDETAPADPQQNQADRKYVFTPEQLAECYSKSSLGHSYSIWIPWDEVGGSVQEVSLLACFVPEEGPPITSQLARVVLEGKSQQAPEAQRSARPPTLPLVETYSRRQPPVGQPPAQDAEEASASHPSTTRLWTASNGTNIPSGETLSNASKRSMRTATLPWQPRLYPQ